jgi:hypothetical protein
MPGVVPPRRGWCGVDPAAAAPGLPPVCPRSDAYSVGNSVGGASRVTAGGFHFPVRASVFGA